MCAAIFGRRGTVIGCRGTVIGRRGNVIDRRMTDIGKCAPKIGAAASARYIGLSMSRNHERMNVKEFERSVSKSWQHCELSVGLACVVGTGILKCHGHLRCTMILPHFG